jgi:hypothetical protein
MESVNKSEVVNFGILVYCAKNKRKIWFAPNVFRQFWAKFPEILQNFEKKFEKLFVPDIISNY